MKLRFLPSARPAAGACRRAGCPALPAGCACRRDDARPATGSRAGHRGVCRHAGDGRLDRCERWPARPRPCAARCAAASAIACRIARQIAAQAHLAPAFARRAPHRSRDEPPARPGSGPRERGQRRLVAARRHHVLQQIVGADREEIGVEVVDRERGGRHLDHHAERRRHRSDALRLQLRAPPRPAARARPPVRRAPSPSAP